ncbi:MAG TPA: hypothetical protein VHP83_00605, partial [Aggregatilineaceae bacterium]|nr:hypothetical protein [Aggregatilineaceae bacterium]
SEAEYGYKWWNEETFDGFVTDVHRLPYAACDGDDCTVLDGGRVLNGGEEFTLPDIPDGQDYLIVLRVQAASPAVLNPTCQDLSDSHGYFVNVVPDIPGQWVELAFWLPGYSYEARVHHFCVQSQQGDKYYPYRYWIYAGSYEPKEKLSSEIAQIEEPGGNWKVTLEDVEVEQNTDAVTVDMVFWTDTEALSHDGKVFIHLYSDPNEKPIKQIDVRPGRGVLPPGNWLPGEIHETYTLPLDGVPPGTYQLAIGLYDPVSFERYTIITQAGETDRLFLPAITIP